MPPRQRLRELATELAVGGDQEPFEPQIAGALGDRLAGCLDETAPPLVDPVLKSPGVAHALLASTGIAPGRSAVLAPVIQFGIEGRGLQFLDVAVAPLEQPDAVLADQYQAGSAAAVDHVHHRPDDRATVEAHVVLAYRDLEGVQGVDRAVGTEEQGYAATAIGRRNLGQPALGLTTQLAGRLGALVIAVCRGYGLTEAVPQGDQPSRCLSLVGRVTRVGTAERRKHGPFGLPVDQLPQFGYPMNVHCFSTPSVGSSISGSGTSMS